MNTAYNVFLGILQDTKNSDVLYVYLRDYVKPPYDYSDLLRWQWAQSVSALDKLVHDLIRIGMLNIFQGTRTPTPKYSSFVIDMDCYSQMIQFPILASSIFEGQVIRKLSYLSFQEPTKISDGLALIWSETNKWKKISDKIGLNEDYTKTKEEAFKEYEDRQNWAKKMLINISKAGYFSSDRTIEEYNRDIWKLQ